MTLPRLICPFQRTVPSRRSRTKPIAVEPLESRQLLSSSAPADATVPQSVTVPIEIVNVGKQKRLAISVAVAGGEARPYLLDTGSTGMFVANHKVDSANYTLTDRMFNQHYTSGIRFKGSVIKTTVDFGQGAAGSDVAIGLIQSARGIPGWHHALKHNDPPYQKEFYGTLGMSLTPGDKKKQGDLYSVIAQLPGNLHTGFIVHTGGMNGSDASLTIGLTDQEIRTFTTIPLPSAGPAGTTYSWGNGAKNNVLAWDDKAALVHYAITGMQAFNAPTVFDTGEPSAVLYTGNVPKSIESKGTIAPGHEFSADVASGETWRFQTGKKVNVNRVDVGKDRKSGTVNTGIGLFFHYDVMYDIKDGLIGFRLPTSTST